MIFRHLLLFGVSLVMSGCATNPSGQTCSLQISTLWNPLPAMLVKGDDQPGSRMAVSLSDVRIPYLFITNAGSSETQIKQIELALGDGSSTLLTSYIQGTEFNLIAHKTYQGLTSNAFIEAGPRTMGIRKRFPQGFSETTLIAPSRTLVIGNVPLHYLGHGLASDLKIRVHTNHNECVSSRIPLIQPRLKNIYHFPLKGAWIVSNGYNSLVGWSHRVIPDIQFAEDYYRIGGNGLSYRAKVTKQNKDKLAYGEPVLAAASGKVVEAVDGIEENAGVGKWPNMDEAFMNDLGKKKGRLAVLIGNYVVIEHANSEYSMYGHLRPGSVKVRKGEVVNTGQQIGAVGNVRLSGGPHLHFQVQDGPDSGYAQTIPLTFSNLLDQEGEPISRVIEGGTMVHTK